jgi:ubiquinone biosynthesis protein
VAVKVQRPGVREQFEADLGLLTYVARLLEALIEETGIYTPSDIVEEFDRAIHEELDFANEARNARDVAAASKDLPFVVVPTVHASLSSSTVLTLDFVEGLKVTDLSGREGYDPQRVARNLIEAAFRQLFTGGIFHGDPHPGNLLVLPGDRIAYLDFGLVGRIGRPMQEALVTLLVAVALRDPETVARVLYRIGVPEAHTPITSLRDDISGILDRYLGLKLDQIRSSTLLTDMLDLAVRHKIKVPREYALLCKSSVTIEGVIRGLYPELDIMEVGLPYAKEMLFSRFQPGDASGALMKSMLKLQGLAEDVPSQLSQILADLEGGKFRVHVRAESIDRLADNVRSLGLTVFLGLLASALALGGLFVVARQMAGSQVVLLLGFSALLFAGFLFGASLTVYWLGGRIPKLSLRKLIARFSRPS